MCSTHSQGRFLPPHVLDIHALYPLAVEVKANAELAYLRGAAVRAFYHLAEEG